MIPLSGCNEISQKAHTNEMGYDAADDSTIPISPSDAKMYATKINHMSTQSANFRGEVWNSRKRSEATKRAIPETRKVFIRTLHQENSVNGLIIGDQRDKKMCRGVKVPKNVKFVKMQKNKKKKPKMKSVPVRRWCKYVPATSEIRSVQ